MVKYTNTTLTKIQELVKEAGYVLRYEKGSFKSGYCILQDKKVIIINKYFETEARINSLFEILPSLQMKMEDLSENSRKFLEKINQKEIAFDSNPS
ncbi:MAG: hypothetical protein WCP57_08680 [Bacteroidota bacterium]|jgi:hypothetical protein